ncbi:MAG: tRNA epoxyqueuosine(34) reductase QueG, partial [Hyphomicrobiales bacterium]
MSISISEAAAIKTGIRDLAISEGFESVGFARTDAIGDAGTGLKGFLKEGREGEMTWLARQPETRADPRQLWPQARSVVALGQNYGPETDPRIGLEQPRSGVISVYARGRDYHDVVKKRLKRVARHMAQTYEADVKVFVDTAPVMEKPLAAAAGLGWQGKHTNLVSRDFGSWLFLGIILTTLDLVPDKAGEDVCGSCTACLDACPTAAFTGPYRIDARRCLSYLTIEYKGHIAAEFRRPMGNRIYGCDDCLAACPWNKFAQAARETKLQARDDMTGPGLATLSRLDDASFRARFSGSPVKRTGRDRFMRN